MNKKQKILTLVTLGVFVLTLFAIPIVRHYPALPGIRSALSSDALKRYIWAIDADDLIRFDILFMEWGGIAVISVILFFLLKDKEN